MSKQKQNKLEELEENVTVDENLEEKIQGIMKKTWILQWKIIDKRTLLQKL